MTMKKDDKREKQETHDRSGKKRTKEKGIQGNRPGPSPIPIPVPSRNPSLARRVGRFVDTLAITLLLLDAVAFLTGHGINGTGPIEFATAALLVGFATLVHIWLRQSRAGLDRAGQEDALLRPHGEAFPASPYRKAPASIPAPGSSAVSLRQEAQGKPQSNPVGEAPRPPADVGPKPPAPDTSVPQRLSAPTRLPPRRPPRP